MKKFFSTLLSVLVVVSCNDNYRYTVSGTIAGANEGDKIVLFFSPNGFDKDIIETTTIADGKFFFDGEIGESTICYIGCENDKDSFYSIFFLEPGKITADIRKERSLFYGTPNNERNRICENTLAHYLQVLSDIENRFYTDSLSAEEMTTLGIKGYETQKALVEHIHNCVEENSDNLFGLFMLVVYNDFFAPEEFSRLIKEVPREFANNNNRFLYDIAVEIAEKKRRD